MAIRTVLLASLATLLTAGSALALRGCGSAKPAAGKKSGASAPGAPAGGSDAGAARVRRGRFELRVSEAGEFRPLNCRVIIPKAGGKLDWLVPEGSAVGKGDLLFSQDRTKQNDQLALDTKERDAALKNLEEVERQVAMERESLDLDLQIRAAAVKLARTQVVELEAGATKEALAGARASLEAARVTAEDRRVAAEADAKMAASGYLSAAEARASKLAADLAGIALEREKLSLAKLEAGASPEARQAARLAVERAEADLAVAGADAEGRRADLDARVADARAGVANYQRSVDRDRRDIAAREVRADTDGVVIYRAIGRNNQDKPEVGSLVWPGNGVLDVADLSNMKVRTQLAERYIRFLAPGSAVRAKPDSVPGVQFDGKVAWIDRWSRDRSSDLVKADREREGLSGVKVFALEAALEGHDPRIRPGSGGTVEFQLIDLPDALIVPRTALYGSETAPFVTVAEGDSVRRVAVEVLAEDEREVAVRGDLAAGQELVARAGP
jgi:hypothetical protein